MALSRNETKKVSKSSCFHWEEARDFLHYELKMKEQKMIDYLLLFFFLYR